MDMLLVCSIGVHLILTKSDAKERGIYVNMNRGKVNKYSIFLIAAARIFLHSVNRVMAPSEKTSR